MKALQYRSLTGYTLPMENMNYTIEPDLDGPDIIYHILTTTDPTHAVFGIFETTAFQI